MASTQIDARKKALKQQIKTLKAELRTLKSEAKKEKRAAKAKSEAKKAKAKKPKAKANPAKATAKPAIKPITVARAAPPARKPSEIAAKLSAAAPAKPGVTATEKPQAPAAVPSPRESLISSIKISGA